MDTSVSLLEKLRQPAQQAAWARFVELYTPFFYYWARRMGLGAEETADLVQEVLIVVFQKLPQFQHGRDKSFRAWLRTILVNKWRENRRRRLPAENQASLAALNELQSADGVDQFAEAEYRRFLVNRSLQLMLADFQPTTWKACWEMVVSGRPAREVAAELGITVKAVYLAKARVLRRLRQELTGLLD